MILFILSATVRAIASRTFKECPVRRGIIFAGMLALSGSAAAQEAEPATLIEIANGGFEQAAFTSGCGEGHDPAIEAFVRDSAGVMTHEFPGGVLERPSPLRLADDPSVRIGVVEGAPEYQWTRPFAAARLADGGFVVLFHAIGMPEEAPLRASLET